jgi:formylglycine-generating enzyme required for sulfatase activity
VGQGFSLARSSGRQEREVLAELRTARAVAATDRDVKTPAALALESRLAQLHRQRESAYESAVVLYLTAAGDAAGSARLRQGLLEIYSNRIRYALATENYGEAGYWLDFLKTWAGQDYGRVPPADRARLDLLAHEVAGDATLAVDSQPADAAVTLWQLRPGPNGVWLPAEPIALGRTPLAPVAVAKGSYLLTFTRPERPEIRCPVFVKHGERVSVAPLLPRQIPEGLAYVPAGRFYAGARPASGGGLREREVAGFFMKIHEVTFREYLRFWLDPAGGRQQPQFLSRLSFNTEERRLDDAWNAAGQLLPPMRHVSSRTVAVEHPKRRVADVRELVKQAGRNVNGLPARDRLPFLAQAHLPRSFDDEIYFLLLLVVPRHLTALGIERDVADAEVLALDGRHAAHQVLRAPSGGIRSPGELIQVCNDHAIGLCP